jgi:hypothetical protein
MKVHRGATALKKKTAQELCAESAGALNCHTRPRDYTFVTRNSRSDELDVGTPTYQQKEADNIPKDDPAGFPSLSIMRGTFPVLPVVSLFQIRSLLDRTVLDGSKSLVIHPAPS